jgi:hypothetical protein
MGDSVQGAATREAGEQDLRCDRVEIGLRNDKELCMRALIGHRMQPAMLTGMTAHTHKRTYIAWDDGWRMGKDPPATPPRA